MQTEATDSSLREGIEALGVKDTEKPAAEKEEEEGNTEQQDAEMTNVTATEEEDTTTKDETGNSFNKHLQAESGKVASHSADINTAGGCGFSREKTQREAECHP